MPATISTKTYSHLRMQSTKWKSLLSVTAVLLLCAFLRLISITTESTTTDEYTTYITTSDATLAEYLKISRYRLPDNLPLYMIVYWGWTQIFGNELLTGRLLSVFCGVGSCALAIVIARRVFGQWAGIIAGIAYALSPFQIFHDQALRPYPLFCLLAGVSTYSILALTEKRTSKSYLTINLTANFLLVYTHLLGAVLVMTQGLFLIVILRNQWKTLLVWSAASALLLLPSLTYVDIPDQDPRYFQPDLSRIFANFFAPEAIHYNVELTPSQENYAYSLPTSWRAIALPTGLLIGLASLFSTLYFPLKMSPTRARLQRSENNESRVIFLVTLTLAPLLILNALSIVIEPIPLPRYNIYTVFARFALIAGMLSLCSLAWLRNGLTSAWLTLLALQLFLVLPAGARTEFYAAARYIENTEAPPRAIYASLYPDSTYIHFPLRVNHDSITPGLLKLHMRSNHEVKPGYSLQEMITSIEADLPPYPHSGHGPDTPHVFIAFLRLYQHGPIEALQLLLEKNGLSYDWRHYYANEGLTVYRVWRSEARTNSTEVESLDTYKFITDWNIMGATDKLLPLYTEAIEERLDTQPSQPHEAGDYVSMSFILGSSSAEVGLSVAEGGIRNYPESGELEIARGTMLYLLQRTDEAKAAWSRANEQISDSLRLSLGSIFNLAISEKFTEAKQEFDRLQQLSGGTIEPLVGQALEMSIINRD